MMKSKKVLLGLGLAILLLVGFFWTLDWSQLLHAYAAAPRWLLALGLVHGFLVYIFRGFRWQYVLNRMGHVQFGTAFWANAVGFGTNAVLPGRVGELVRALAVRSETRIPTAHVLATIALERIVDFFIASVVFLVYVMLGPLRGWFWAEMNTSQLEFIDVIAVGVLVTFLLVGVVVVYLVLWVRRGGIPVSWEPMTEETSRWRRWMSHITMFFRQLAHGLILLGELRHLLQYLALSVVFWLFVMFGIWIHLVPFSPQFPIYGAPWLVVMVILGTMLPTPAGIGGYHWGVRLGLNLFYGVPAGIASAAAIWSHFCSITPAVVLTAWVMIRRGLSFHELLGGKMKRPGPDPQETVNPYEMSTLPSRGDPRL